MEGLTKSEQGNRRKGMIFSIVFHMLIFIMFTLFGFTFQNPPPEAAGVLVNLGIPDVGQGNENAPEGKPAEPVVEETPEPVKEETPEPVKEETPEPVKESSKPPKETPKTEPKKDVVKTEDPEAAALKKKKEEERKKAEAEAKAKADAEARAKAEAKAKADAEARQKAEEARKAQELKDKIGGALGGGKGKGKGDTGTPGNQGDPNGGDSDILKGKTTGSGVVEGFGGRGYTKPAPPQDNSQETGNVAITVCVDKNGNVVSADYTQKGSTTTSATLKAIAISNARKYKFAGNGPDKQCGTITYRFSVK